MAMPAYPLPVHRVPAFEDNYIWLFEYSPGKVAVVDPGEARPVLAALEAMGLQATHILNTHWHPDHVGGNLELKAATGCQIIGPAREAERIPGLDAAVDEGETVRLGDQTGHVLFVGAHTAGHIAFHFPQALALFPGDTLFAMGCGRLFEGSAEDMFSAMGKLARLPGDTRVFCAHEYTLSNARFAVTVEPENQELQRRYEAVQQARASHLPTVPFRLEEELATNPFLRAHDAARLGEIRRAKDVF